LHLQKLLFLTNAEEDVLVLTQHWSELTKGKACVVKTQPNALEIVSLDASKDGGIRVLLDHLGITEDVRIHSINELHLLFLLYIISSQLESIITAKNLFTSIMSAYAV
jgi:hypothetical protein